MRVRVPARPAAALALLVAIALPACDRAPTVESRTDFVMGTLAELKVVSDDPVTAREALDRAFARLREIEALTTSYSETSEPARLARANGAWVEGVSPEVDEILTLGLRIAAESDGAFDPTAGALVAAWGWPEDPALPDSATVAAAVATVGWRDVERAERAPGRIAWRLGRPGMKLDLGGVAKGWAVDRAADVLLGVSDHCIVNAGGDLVVRGHRPDGKAWLIGVQDPRDASRIFLKLRLPDGTAVATSGDYQRFFEVDGVRYHHLLDPRTGWPAREVHSATVIAPDCATADAWATAAFVLGAEAGIAALERQPDLEGLLVTYDAKGDLVSHETPGFARYRE
ncbi:MAG: FAD:protein FMN transferase [Gemmatimonadetes bacterium]|nr:FAD:protein FMN transferase [Gemmatimonadota bacterium]